MNNNKYNVTVSNSHVNNKKEINYFSIINFLQDVEGTHIDSLKSFNNYLEKHNIGVFLMYRRIDILKRPKFGDKLTLTTYPFSTKRASGYRHIFILNEEGQKIVKTTAFGAFVNLDTYLPERLPIEVIKTINDGIRDESLIDLGRKINYEITENKLINECIIKKSHIDRYNHVNNAHYLSFVLDGLDDFYFDRIRIVYQKSFLLGDKVLVYLNTQEKGRKVAILTNEFDEIYAIMELSTINE